MRKYENCRLIRLVASTVKKNTPITAEVWPNAGRNVWLSSRGMAFGFVIDRGPLTYAFATGPLRTPPGTGGPPWGIFCWPGAIFGLQWHLKDSPWEFRVNMCGLVRPYVSKIVSDTEIRA